MNINKLTLGEAERLAILIEECAEVIQAATKILRHGYDSKNPFKPSGPDNRGHLEEEIGHLENISSLMCSRGDTDYNTIQRHSSIKKTSIKKYLHHQ